jgi:hypothetical protein
VLVKRLPVFEEKALRGYMKDEEMIEELGDIIEFDPVNEVKDSAHASHHRCLWLSNQDYIDKLMEEREAEKNAELKKIAEKQAKKEEKERIESDKIVKATERKEKKDMVDAEKKRKAEELAQNDGVKKRNVKVKCDNSLCTSTCFRGDVVYLTWSKCSTRKCKKMFCIKEVCVAMPSGQSGHINVCQNI